MLHDQNAHGDDPHHDDRSHVLNTRQLQAQDLLASDRELVAMVEQVGCEEERKEQLGEFAGLELSKTRNLHPNTRSVLFGAQHWQHRGKQQYQADHHTDVRESPQQTVILHENRQHIRQHQRNGQPYQLSERHGSVRRLIKPGDHHHTDAGQHHHAAQNRLVRIRLETQQQGPRANEQHTDENQHPQIILRKTTGRAFEHLEERHGADHQAKQHQRQLPEAGRHHDASPPVASDFGDVSAESCDLESDPSVVLPDSPDLLSSACLSSCFLITSVWLFASSYESKEIP